MLLYELRRGVLELDVPLEEMLRIFTTSPALRLGKEGVKGCIQEGADADLLVLDKELNISSVMAKGQLAMNEGKVLLKGTFEE